VSIRGHPNRVGTIFLPSKAFKTTVNPKKSWNQEKKGQ